MEPSQQDVKANFINNKVALLFKQVPVTILAYAVNTIFLYVVLMDVVELPLLNIWYGCTLFTLLFRFSIYSVYKKSSLGQHQPPILIIAMCASVAISGIALSSALFLVPLGQLVYLLIITIIITGMCVGAATTLVYYPSAMHSFLIPSLTIVIVRFYQESEVLYWAIPSVVVFFWFMITFTSKLNRKDHDIHLRHQSELEQASKALQHTQIRLVDHMRSTPLAAIEWNLDLQIISWNQAAETIFGFRQEEALGQEPEIIVPLEIRPMVREIFAEMYQQRGGTRSTNQNVCKNGSIITCEWYNTPLQDDNGELIGMASLAQDVTERIEQQELIAYQANYDELTELPNRRHFTEILQHAIDLTKRSHAFGAVLFIDLDHFKAINDTLGHGAGDDVLKRYATLLKENLRGSETVARFGGDEFIVLIENLSTNEHSVRLQVETLANKLQLLTQKPIKLKGNEYVLECSIGAVIFSEKQTGVEEILRRADLALYQVKNQGRGGFAFYDKQLTTDALRHMALMRGLRQAIELDEFSLHYQPKVSASDHNSLEGAEVLLRWDSAIYGSVSPAEFIPVLEVSAMMTKVGDWVIESALSQLDQWKKQGVWHDHMVLSINISPKQIVDLHFPIRVQKLLSRYNVSENQVEFEITETTLVEDTVIAAKQLHRISALGVRFAIDDFGTGYSSLSYLRDLPLQVLKIDKSFVDNCVHQESDMVLVSTILSICQQMGYQSVAEGVETLEQAQLLEHLGCDCLQGFAFGKPLTAEEFCRQMLS